jgi:hypothetical protein
MLLIFACIWMVGHMITSPFLPYPNSITNVMKTTSVSPHMKFVCLYISFTLGCIFILAEITR